MSMNWVNKVLSKLEYYTFVNRAFYCMKHR